MEVDLSSKEGRSDRLCFSHTVKYCSNAIMFPEATEVYNIKKKLWHYQHYYGIMYVIHTTIMTANIVIADQLNFNIQKIARIVHFSVDIL